MDTLFFKTSIAFYSLPKPGTKNIPRFIDEKQNTKKIRCKYVFYIAGQSQEGYFQEVKPAQFFKFSGNT